MSSKALLASVLALVVVSCPLQAAPRKADPKHEALVKAMRAVSPDSLGGRLGLEIATSAMPKPAPATSTARPVANATERSADLAGYLAWKRTTKS